MSNRLLLRSGPWVQPHFAKRRALPRPKPLWRDRLVQKDAFVEGDWVTVEVGPGLSNCRNAERHPTDQQGIEVTMCIPDGKSGAAEPAAFHFGGSKQWTIPTSLMWLKDRDVVMKRVFVEKGRRPIDPDRSPIVCNDGLCVVKYVPFKKKDLKHGVVFGEVYVPWEVDSQGDWMTLDDIRKMAWNWMENWQLVGHNHEKVSRTFGTPVESFVLEKPYDVWEQGGWILGTKIKDDRLKRMVENDEITGYSIAGEGNRIPEELPAKYAVEGKGSWKW